MKKQLIALGVLSGSLLMFAAKPSDPVLMTVNGKDVHLSEFEYLYHKNNAQQVAPQSLDEYLQMFIDYKLKVADAEAAGIDTTAAFVTEFTQFRNELSEPYMQDQAALDSLVEQTYDHMANDVYVSHIMVRSADAAALDSLRTAILQGRTTFEDVAREYSIDRPSAERGGLMGWVIANRYPWAFEEAAYATAPGDISPILDSGFGYHIIRVEERVPAHGEVIVDHILLQTRNANDSVVARQKELIDSLYTVAVADNGATFGELAMRFSQDPGSAQRGGRLDWFGPGAMVEPFDSIAFAMPVGAVSEPFETAFGWHIIHKIDARVPGSLEESRDGIIRVFGNDERGGLPRRKFMIDMINKYNGQQFLENDQKVAELADQLGGVYDSTMVASLMTCKIPLYSINGVKYSVADVMPTVPMAALRGGENIAPHIRKYAALQLGERALDLARADLMITNPDYRNLVNEYRDGILLFEISNRNVWQRAADNKDELEAYFAANRDKYTWPAPKFKSYVIFADNDSILNEAVALASTLPEDVAPATVTQTLRDKFGRSVKVERVIAAKGENAITDFLGFGGPKPSSDNSRWPSYAAFRGRIIESPEESTDVRGLVVADFQAALERDWVQQLRNKYKVKVNRKVLNQVQ